MKINYTIPKGEYDRLKRNSDMLGRICCEVRRYAHTPTTTTYECVVAMKERLRTMNKKIGDHKKAGGTFLKPN